MNPSLEWSIHPLSVISQLRNSMSLMHSGNARQALLCSRPADVCGRNSGSRLWKIYFDPQVLFGTSEGRIYHPVSF